MRYGRKMTFSPLLLILSSVFLKTYRVSFVRILREWLLLFIAVTGIQETMFVLLYLLFVNMTIALNFADRLPQVNIRQCFRKELLRNYLETKRASIYGIAHMAQHASTNALEPHARWIVQEWSQMTSKPELHDETMFENAIQRWSV